MKKLLLVLAVAAIAVTGCERRRLGDGGSQLAAPGRHAPRAASGRST